MNLQQLEYIVALDQHRSFSRAAEACFITQATMSTMVKRLEKELDIVIFDRQTNPIVTTDCGREVVREARRILDLVAGVKSMAAELKGKVQGELRLGVIPTVAANLLPRVLPAIPGRYPGLQLYVQELTTAAVLQKLKTGELDAGIVSTPLKSMACESEVLYFEKLMVYGHGRRTSTRYLTPRDLSGEQVWLLEKGHCLTDQVIHVCTLNPGKINPNLHFQPGSFDSLINIVDRMKGLTLLPELCVLDLPEARKRRVSDFSHPFPVREISMIYERPYAKARLISVVAEEIRSAVRPVLQTHALRSADMVIAGM